MDATLDAAALVLAAAGLAVAVVATVLTTGWRSALGAALELWLAAGLLRLAGDVTWKGVAVAASVVGVRRLVGASLLRPQRSTTKPASTSDPSGATPRSGAGSSPGSVPP